MKKVLLFSIFIAVFALSCNSDESKVVDSNNSRLENAANGDLEKLSFSVIGVKKDNNIVLNISKDKLLEVFRAESKRNGLEGNPLSCRIEKINNKDYLRFHNDDDTVSTIELLVDSEGNVTTGGTVCKSKACASGGGCLPNGLYCTECKTFNFDCERTTTGLTPAPNP